MLKIPKGFYVEWQLVDFWKLCDLSIEVVVIEDLTGNKFLDIILDDYDDWEFIEKYNDWYINYITIKNGAIYLHVYDDIKKLLTVNKNI